MSCKNTCASPCVRACTSTQRAHFFFPLRHTATHTHTLKNTHTRSRILSDTLSHSVSLALARAHTRLVSHTRAHTDDPSEEVCGSRGDAASASLTASSAARDCSFFSFSCLPSLLLLSLSLYQSFLICFSFLPSPIFLSSLFLSLGRSPPSLPGLLDS